MKFREWVKFENFKNNLKNHENDLKIKKKKKNDFFSFTSTQNLIRDNMSIARRALENDPSKSQP